MTQIKAQIEDTTSDYDREKLQERLAKLAGGVAVIKVGAATEVELKEKKHRIEDALSTTRAAVEEGLVAGGGTTLLQAIPALDKHQARGRRAGRRRHRPQGARGAGPPDRRQRRPVRRGRRDTRSATCRVGHGYDALKGEYGDMFEKGIVDAAKVTRSALQNAASIAAMVLTTETLITDLPEKEKAGGGGGHGHGRRRDGLLVRALAQPATTTAPGASPPGVVPCPSRRAPARGVRRGCPGCGARRDSLPGQAPTATPCRVRGGS